MNTEVISKAAYSNGLQENGQDGVVFTMPASRKKFIYKSTFIPTRLHNKEYCYFVGWGFLCSYR